MELLALYDKSVRELQMSRLPRQQPVVPKACLGRTEGEPRTALKRVFPPALQPPGAPARAS